MGYLPKKDTKQTPWWRRLLLGMALALLLLALVVGGWVGSNLALRHEEPKQLWTEADLPSLPAHEKNGWTTFNRESNSLGRVNSDVNKLVTSLHVSSHPSPSDAWKEVRSSESEIRTKTSDPSHRPWVELIGRTYAMPAFADACPLELEMDMKCNWLGLFRAHQLAELAMLTHALDGRWNEALVGTKRLAFGDAAFVQSSRSLLSQMIGIVNATHTVELVELLLAGYQQPNERRAEVNPSTWIELTTALSSVKRSDLTMERAVMAEYLLYVRGLDVIAEDPRKAGMDGWGSASGVFFDKGATLELLNQDFESLMEFTKKPGSPEPKRQRFTEGGLWWLRNPVGKLAMDLGRTDIVNFVKKGNRKADALISKRDAVLPKIEKAKKTPRFD